MVWEEAIIKDKPALIKPEDQSYVEIRPKYYVGSNGSLWAKSLLELVLDILQDSLSNLPKDCLLR